MRYLTKTTFGASYDIILNWDNFLIFKAVKYQSAIICPIKMILNLPSIPYNIFNNFTKTPADDIHFT